MCYFSPFTPAHRIKDALGIARVSVDGADLSKESVREIVREEVAAFKTEVFLTVPLTFLAFTIGIRVRIIAALSITLKHLKIPLCCLKYA